MEDQVYEFPFEVELSRFCFKAKTKKSCDDLYAVFMFSPQTAFASCLQRILDWNSQLANTRAIAMDYI